MNVLLDSVGTDGDLFPYAGLGAALRSRGHSVSLAASAHYDGLAKTHGFTFHSLISAEENDDLFGNPDFWNPFKTAPLSARWGVKFLRALRPVGTQLRPHFEIGGRATPADHAPHA